MSGGRIPVASQPEEELDHPVHLVPLVQELIARGNRLATPSKPYDGFAPTKGGWQCWLVDYITPED